MANKRGKAVVFRKVISEVVPIKSDEIYLKMVKMVNMLCVFTTIKKNTTFF